ncbi:Flp family type IVb pilin [Aggregatibacter actinomycetemcomitans]|uniref:Fimbrial protein Flp n=1 Tax=Aggregatibacter actinomycetemcomitans TaxID=714 RepID=Q93GW6_AGGAC|nr:Flp family type IVb pilin [Aggregatibacter actinomycetemcomitans]AAL93282.1 flp-1 protein [Aggregatibacter actinomycetemcomitans Y4]AAL93272.1 flp-1 protein [Aggregatibacter actinomycetemcomitans]AAL93273.1 flp-1 protein [Aggregatibacter actinomycetemcomitans]AAL93283.1 flp-1 protein [Aggregatibacter actinomycetemcomitans]AAL93289.1 flp-1 protein [Aggregatibacter actinomycetemcomitans]
MLNTLTTKAYIKAAEAIRSFRENQAGVTAIEYGLIAIAVAVLIVAVFYSNNGFIANLQNKFNSLASTVGSADVGKK